ncbi:MAG TPA: phosphatidylglycerophosphatase A [Phycisphaerae bacterium]|nr:phosphatidylglycerophosphatase A [Phycisphaerae bacterium]HNU45187.1 phosphatidylglycerophosphatase A [Phycisphaerae bacterium]
MTRTGDHNEGASVSDMPAKTGQRRAWQTTLLWIGSVGPLGYAPASGTVTVAVVGIPVFAWTRGWPWFVYVPAVVVFSAASVWLHSVGDRLLGTKDSRRLVWDELAGYFVAVALVPFTWQTALASFVLERGLDIVKFPPGNLIEKHLPGGWGVVGDDLVAGLYTCVLMHALVHWVPAYLGLPAAG